jgi:predicted Zn-dependent peptidase
MTFQKLNINYKAGILKSELKFFHFERKGAPIKIQFVFEGGAVEDPFDKQGLAHFLEHMIVAGTEKYPSKDLLSQELERLGGSYSAFTNIERIVINFLIPSKDELSNLTPIIQEVFFKLLFSEKTFEQERKSIISEIGLAKSSPQKCLEELYRQAFFSGSVFSQSILGTEESLERITLNDLKVRFQTMLSTNKVSVISAGDISFNEIKAMLETLVFKQGSADTHELYTPGSPTLLEQNTATQNAFMRIGYRFEKVNLQEYAALQVFKQYLAGSRSSQLLKRLRYEKGLVYECYADLRMHQSSTVFFVNTSSLPRNFEEVKEIIATEFKKGSEELLIEEKVRELVVYMKKNMPFQYETSHTIINNQYNLLHDFDRPYTLDDYIVALNQVTSSKIKAVVEKYLNEENFASAVLRPNNG